MESRKKRNAAVMIIIGLLAGAAGGFLRYMNLKTGFTSEGLAEPGNLWGTVLAWLSVAAGLLLLGTAIYVKRSGALRDVLGIGAIGSKTLILSMVASILLFIGGVCAIAGSLIPVSVLGLMSGILMLASAPVSVHTVRRIAGRYRGGQGVSGGAAVLLPVFLACVALIAFYKDVSANPETKSYFYELFSHIFLILALFSGGGYVFSRASLEKLFFTLVGYLYFGTISAVSGWIGLINAVSKSGIGILVEEGGLIRVAETLLFTYGFFFTAALLCLFFVPRKAAAADILGD